MFLWVELFQVKQWCAVGSCLVRTSGRCVRRWEDGGHHQMMRSHHFLKPTKTLLPPAVTRSRMIHQHIVLLMEQVRLSQTTENIHKALRSLNRTRSQTIRWKRMSGAGTVFLMRPMTYWTGYWTWTLPQGSQLPRLCSTRCSQTCETAQLPR